MKSGKKIYFASDFHLGVPDYQQSLLRERRIVNWLKQIENDAAEIYLLGDVFDFWFEYKTVIPKGFVRLIGKLAELSDQGIPIHFFSGNHDMWMYDYFSKELNITIYRNPIIRDINGKRFYLAHGDGLGPMDYGYKFIKKIFTNPICQWLFARIHPNIGISIAHFWSRKSRVLNQEKGESFGREENERLLVYCKDLLKNEHFDFMIFGHRHLPLDIKLNENSRYINLGEWINYNSYAVFDGEKLELMYYNSK